MRLFPVLLFLLERRRGGEGEPETSHLVFFLGEGSFEVVKFGLDKKDWLILVLDESRREGRRWGKLRENVPSCSSFSPISICLPGFHLILETA